MTNRVSLYCDGCGQPAVAEHIARRLKRLEWTTRYRPVHIGTLLLGAAAPAKESDFLYSPSGKFTGEAALVAEAAGIDTGGKERASVLAEFQRGGFFLAHALECPLDGPSAAETEKLLAQRLPSVVARIRRSLKPKRLVPVSSLLGAALQRFKPEDLGCAMVLDAGKAFGLDGEQPREAVRRLRDSLVTAFASR